MSTTHLRYVTISSLAAVALLCAARIWQIAAFSPQYSDTGVYFRYVVQGVDFRQPAYSKFDIEYPPVAYWAMALPRVVAGERITEQTIHDEAFKERSYAAYATAYRVLMLLCELGALALLVDLVRRRRPEALAWAVWTYAIASTLLVHVVLDRLDMGLWLFIVAWAYTRCRAEDAPDDALWRKLSYLLLGLSVAYKLLTVVALPFVLLSDWQQARRQTSSAIRVAIWFVAGVVVPLLVHFPFAGLAPLKFLEFHGGRGIEIESTYASILLVLRPLGLDVATKSAFGSIDLVSPISPLLASASTWLSLAALAGLGLFALVRGAAFGSRDGTRFGLVALLITLVFAKVLSAQFFVFALPIIILLTSENASPVARWLVSLACIAIAACTTAVFPYLWFSLDPRTGAPLNSFGLVPGLSPLPCTLLVVRNALFIALVLWLAIRILKQSVQPSPKSAAIASG